MSTKPLPAVLPSGSRDEALRTAMVRKETIANTIVTAVVAVIITWLLFRHRDPIPVFDAPPGGAFGIVPGTFNFTLLVTLILTLVVRNRVRKGQVPSGSVSSFTACTRLLPRNIILRGLLMASAMSLIFIPVTYAILWFGIEQGIFPRAWPLAGMELLFAIHFSLLSIVVTSLVVARALRD